MYMQKKIYVAPNFEVIETEPESMMVSTSPGGTTNFGPGDIGDIGKNDPEDMSNKRQPDAPWSKSPWE